MPVHQEVRENMEALKHQLWLPRKERPKRQELQAFVTLIAWKCCGRAFPRSCARLLELLFAARWEKLPVGLERGQDYPFSEPIRIDLMCRQYFS